MRAQSLSWLAGLVAIAVTSGCSATSDMAMQGTAEDEAAIRALADRYVVAFNANDAAGIAALVSDDYQAVAPDGTLMTGKAGVEKMLGMEMQMRQKMNVNLTLSVSTSFLHWLDAGNATMGGSWTATGAPQGQPDRGSWLAVAHKSPEGEWMLVSDLASNYMEPPSAAEPPSATAG